MSLMAAMLESQGVSPNPTGVQGCILQWAQKLHSDQGPEPGTLPSPTCLEKFLFQK